MVGKSTHYACTIPKKQGARIIRRNAKQTIIPAKLKRKINGLPTGLGESLQYLNRASIDGPTMVRFNLWNQDSKLSSFRNFF